MEILLKFFSGVCRFRGERPAAGCNRNIGNFLWDENRPGD